MIEHCTAWKVGEQTFVSLEDAQHAALEGVIGEALTAKGDVCAVLIQNKARVIEILGTVDTKTPEKKPRKKRSDYGTTRKAKEEPDLPGV